MGQLYHRKKLTQMMPEVDFVQAAVPCLGSLFRIEVHIPLLLELVLGEFIPRHVPQ